MRRTRTPVRCSPPRPARASTASAASSTPGCGRGRAIRAPPAPARCSTPGRPSTSTTTSTGSPRWPTPPPSVGVERFVLDDGWFRHRRDDTAGLGDWYVDEGVWPDGLHPLVDARPRLGMEFGLWVEPEMVNPDSDLARAHPDWVLRRPGTAAAAVAPPAGARPRAPGRVRLRAGAARRAARASTPSPTSSGTTTATWSRRRATTARPGVHEQTLAAVPAARRAARAATPALEIESCASGGGRVDLGILDAHRPGVDAATATTRSSGRRSSAGPRLLLPPELMGAHVGPAAAHTTGRTARPVVPRRDRAVRPRRASSGTSPGSADADRAGLTSWIAFYQAHRALLHGRRGRPGGSP